jgi:hypothetical protein
MIGVRLAVRGLGVIGELIANSVTYEFTNSLHELR